MVNIGLSSILEEVATVAVQYPLIDVLEGARHARSTDSRDKIFALLNLCHDSTALGVRPEYSITAAEVFRKVAHSLVADGQGGRLLLSGGIAESTLGLPSWVPDWSLQTVSFNNVVGSCHTFSQSDYRSQDSKTSGMRIGPIPDQLIISTSRIDHVAVVHPICSIDHAKEPRSLRDLNDIQEELSRASIFSKIPNAEIRMTEGDIVDFKSKENAHGECSTAQDICERLDAHIEWPSLSRLVYLSIVWIKASPRYEAQNPHEVALYTLTCDHAYGTGGEKFSQNLLQDLRNYLDFTRYVHDPGYRPEHVQIFMASTSRLSASADDSSSNQLRNAYGNHLLSQRDATTRMLLTLGRFCHEMGLACTRSGYVGIVPAKTQSQDVLVCIEGVQAPMILRPVEGSRFQLVGAAFFHGFMPEEFLLARMKKEKDCEELILV